ncbi:MAG TPA: TonB family protein [Chitinophagales bacterium]|nr:TonB family protein [Chitinophagales bacterium]
MPQYPGGNDSLLREIAARVDYPVQCSDSNIQGKVYLRFVVNTDGSIADVHAVKSPHPLLSVAAIAATKGLKKFAPGLQQGKPVRVWYSVPVNFKVKTSVTGSVADTIYEVVDEPALYNGGADELATAIAKEMVYPREEFQNGVHGQVFLKLLINEKGEIQSTTVSKSVSPGLDQEALRIVKRLKGFKPAIINQTPVKSYYSLPIDFNLHTVEHTLYFGSAIGLVSLQSTFATTAGATDNRRKFLFYYYNGGYEAYSQFIVEKMIYPETAFKSKTEAIIKVNCRINNELKLEAVKVLNDPENVFTNEALRLIKLVPPFNEELRGSTFLKDTLPINVVFVLDKRHSWGQSAQKDEKEADMLVEEGTGFYNKGKYEKSIDYFSAAIRYYSLHSKAFFNRGVALLKLNDKQGACEDFRTAFLLGDLDATDAIKQTCP